MGGGFSWLPKYTHFYNIIGNSEQSEDPEQPDPPTPGGDPTFAAGQHEWTAAADGAWNESAKWTTRPSGSDWPNHEGAVATVSAAAAIDLGGETVTLKQFTASGSAVTLRNGTIRIGAGDGSSCFQTTAEGGKLTLENVNLESTVTSTSYKNHCVNPYAANATLEFVGSCSLDGMLIRNSKSGVTLAFRNGTTVSDSGFNFGNPPPAMTVVSENARFRAAELSSSNLSCAFDVTLGANNDATTAVFSFDGAFTVAGSSTLKVDARGKAAGSYPIFAAKTLTDAADFAHQATVQCDAGLEAEFVLANNTLTLKLTSPQPGPTVTEVAVPALSSASGAYTAKEQKPTVPASSLYTVAYGAGNWTDVGRYTVTVTLANRTTHMWADQTHEPKTLTYEITKAANAWTADPSVSPVSFKKGTQPTVSLGAAKFGQPTANFTAAAIAALEPGQYDLLVTVAETANYGGLQREVSFTVTAGDEPLPTVSGAYSWTGAKSSAWAEAGNWTGVTGGTYPQLTTDVASFLLGGTVDLGGATYSLSSVTNFGGQSAELRNGTLVTGSRITLMGGSMVFRDMKLGGLVAKCRLYPYYNGMTATFAGNCEMDANLLFRVAASCGFVVEDGVLKMASPVSIYAGGAYSFSVTLDNARFEGATLVPNDCANCSVSLKVTLGANNQPGGAAVVAMSEAFRANSGSTLVIDAKAAQAGTYTILQAASFLDYAGLVENAQANLQLADGQKGTVALQDNALVLTLAGDEPEPPEQELPVVNGHDVEFSRVFEAANSKMNIVYPTKPTVEGGFIKCGNSVVKIPAYYTVTVDNLIVSMTLNENAAPAIGSPDEGEPAFEVDDESVFIRVLENENVDKTLYYAIGEKASLAEEWTVPETYKALEGSGVVEIPRKAEDQGGFYRVFVSDVPNP